ncbi:MAG: DUF4143 domain-containing protein [Promicromonosporaceae bacterium]|nr:DUF4143 domain-containing protein [Promicromonosporaceae bacterium]
MSYRLRIVDALLDRLCADLPALALEGARGVGKTATASRRAQTILALDDEAELGLTSANPARITALARPLLIDEWQLVPTVWDRVRRAVDAGAKPGDFLLTGSATPTDAPRHSGAGRIVRVRMRPMSLVERNVTEPTVSLAELLTGSQPGVGGESRMRLADYAEEITASGFPAIRRVPARSRADALGGYLDEVLERDLPGLGVGIRTPGTLRQWLRAFAASTAQVTAYDTITKAATPGDEQMPSKATTIAYREALEQLWLLEELPAWLWGRTSINDLAVAPKHHLTDPALATRLLGVSAAALLDHPNPDGQMIPRKGPLIGAMFESLATLCVRVYADACGAQVSHLRTHRGEREVDLIVERNDGRVVAIEIKLDGTVDNSDVKHLRWLRDKLGDIVLDTVVITTGPGAYRREDGVAVVPLALLGP